MNISCIGGRTVEPEVALGLVGTYLAAEYSLAKRHFAGSAKSRR